MRVIDRRGGDREYVVARATCAECGDPILLWRTEFDDHPAVETWKHSDGGVLCERPMVAKPAEGTVEHVRNES